MYDLEHLRFYKWSGREHAMGKGIVELAQKQKEKEALQKALLDKIPGIKELTDEEKEKIELSPIETY